MPENSWYVEGSCLDRFLNGEIYLERPHQNKILIVVNKADRQSINAVSGARATIGSNAEIVELEKPIELIASALNKPVAHGPVDYAIPGFEEVVDPRKAIEIVTLNFIHCLLKGLHKAPRLTRTKRNGSLGVEDIDILVSPMGCLGPPHRACLERGIPIVVVRENRSVLNEVEDGDPRFIFVDNYMEAAGLMMAMKAGIHPASVRRPLAQTVVRSK